MTAPGNVRLCAQCGEPITDSYYSHDEWSDILVVPFVRTRTFWHEACKHRLWEAERSAAFYPYLCGEPGCRERGAVPIPMAEMTAHWRTHRDGDL